jgi:hypothetical protein
MCIEYLQERKEDDAVDRSDSDFENTRRGCIWRLWVSRRSEWADSQFFALLMRR